MGASVIYKPRFQNGGGGVVATSGSNIVVKDKDGKVVYQGSATKNSEGSKFQLPMGKIPPGATFSIDGGPANNIKDPTQRAEFDSGGGNATSTGGRGSSAAANGGFTNPNAGSSNPEGAPLPKGVSGGQQGNSSVDPYYNSNQPVYHPTNYDPIQAAAYNQTDPAAYGQQYGKAVTGQFDQNFNQSGQMGLSQVNTELKGLESFAPATQALQQRLTSADNQSNQAARSAQVASTLPGVQANLNAQTTQAGIYASGNLPDSIQNNLFSQGANSQGADSATASGFGGNSIASARSQNLLNVNQRLQLSQYGNGLVENNSTAQQQLNMAPMEYNSAGSQIKIMPTMSAAQNQTNQQNMLNPQNLISSTTALASKVGQEQYKTNLQQETNKFNSVNTLQNDQFNAQNQYGADLNMFNYNNGYLNSLQGAQQAEVNQNQANYQQQQYLTAFMAAQAKQQTNQIIGGIMQGLSALVSSGGGSSLLSGIEGLFGGGSSGGSSGLSLGSSSSSIFGDLGGGQSDASAFNGFLGDSSIGGDSSSSLIGASDSGFSLGSG